MEQYLPHLDYIDSQSQHMAHLVYQWSGINSGSYHTAGLARMLQALEDNFLWLHADSVERIDLAPLKAIDSQGNEIEIPLGQALRLRKRPHAARQVFLGGHMDTVFGKDHSFQKPNFKDENTLHGPGVADLKGGLVVMLKALEAFEKSPWANELGWEIVLNPDEEIGSQGSDFLFKEAATRCQLGMIYEPALADGTLAGARKGSGNFTFVVRGKAAHAGRDFDKGANAIVAAAEVIAALNAMNGQREEVTINVGKIEGGGALNMVPDLAIVRLNVRIRERNDQDWIMEKFDSIYGLFRNRNDISVHLHGNFTRAPKPMASANQQLFEQVQTTGAMLGLDVKWKATGGCCDGNNLWSYGVPNIDTLGVRGGLIHTDQEWMAVDSLAERAKLSALHLMRLANGDVVIGT